MARKTYKLLAGSLNFSAPVDMLPAGDAIANKNWRPDQLALLRSRQREAAIGAGFNPPVRSLHLWQSGPTRYFGDAAELYRSGLSIASGFDGKRLGMVSYLGFTWVMNRAKQGKDDGTNWRDWLPAAPAAAPNVAVIADVPATAAATATPTVVRGVITAVTVTAGGSGYVSEPTVTVTGEGSGARLRAVVVAGVVTAIKVLNGGSFYDPADTVDIATSAPTGAIDSLTGTYTYYVSFDTAAGHESDLSPASAPFTAGGQAAALSSIPTSTDPQVTKRHIYRSGGTQDQLYRIGTLNDNTTTTFNDSTSDENASADGVTHTADHQPPPAARGLGGPYYDRLIAYSSAAHPNWIWWTPQLKLWYWPGSNLDEGNHMPVGDDGEEIVNATQRPRAMLFYKSRSVWRLVGDPDDASGELECISPDVGQIGEAAGCTYGGIDYFQGAEGIYASNGDRVTLWTPKLAKLFRGEALPAGSEPAYPLNQDLAVRAKACMAAKNGRLYFSYADTTATENNRTLVFDIATGACFSDDRGFAALYYEGQTGDLVGAIGGAVYTLEGASSGAAIPLVYQSGFDDQGSPEIIKRYTNITADHHTGGSALALSAVFSAGAASEAIGTLNSAARTFEPFPLANDGYEARNISLRLTGDGTGEVNVYGLGIEYEPIAIETMLWDSGVIDLGSPKAKDLAQIMPHIRTAGTVTYRIYSDLPDGGLAVVETGTLAHHDGQRRPPIPLAAIRQGRLFRFVLQSPAAFRLYGFSAWVRPVGLFLPAGEILELPASDLGTKRVKLVRRLEVDLDGALDTKVWTDLPGPALAVRSLSTLTGAGRKWTGLGFSGGTRGRLVKVDWTATVDTRVYAARLYAKAIGEAGASSWQWFPLPVEPTPESFSWVEIPAFKS